MVSLLIVEPDQSRQEAFRNYLHASKGYTVELALDAAAAVACIRHHHFDAILVNCDTPLLDEVNLTSIARSSRKNRHTAFILHGSPQRRQAFERFTRVDRSVLIPYTEPHEELFGQLEGILSREESLRLEPPVFSKAKIANIKTLARGGLDRFLGFQWEDLEPVNDLEPGQLHALIHLRSGKDSSLALWSFNQFALQELYDSLAFRSIKLRQARQRLFGAICQSMTEALRQSLQACQTRGYELEPAFVIDAAPFRAFFPGTYQCCKQLFLRGKACVSLSVYAS